MNLHDIVPDIKHAKIPLWTQDAYDELAALHGYLTDIWDENDLTLALWQTDDNPDLAFIINCFDADGTAEEVLAEINRPDRRHPYDWSIWEDHVLNHRVAE